MGLRWEGVEECWRRRVERKGRMEDNNVAYPSSRLMALAAIPCQYRPMVGRMGEEGLVA